MDTIAQLRLKKIQNVDVEAQRGANNTNTPGLYREPVDETRTVDKAIPGRTRALDIATGATGEQQVPAEVLDVGTSEDPFTNIRQNYIKGGMNMRSNSKYFQAAFKSAAGY